MKTHIFCILIVVLANYMIGCASHQGIDPEQSGVMSNIAGNRGIPAAHVISAEARDEYNSLISDYGDRLFKIERKRLKTDEGLQPGDDGYIMESEYMHYFKEMSKWKKKDLSALGGTKMKTSK